MSAYQKQDRGTAAEYAAYFGGMNKSMQQKVALTTAHFPTQGTLADMGSGSGNATFDLANLYGGLTLVGVDINPAAVEHSNRTHIRPNLSYRAGDIADPLFPPESLDGILNSSVLHHVTSFNGFSLKRLEDLFDHQVAALRPGGVLVVRDFVVPRGPTEVDLELPNADGAASGPIPDLSTAALFVRFAATFRCSQNLDGPVPFAELPPRHPGHRRFRLTLRAATEFVLRKDYRDHWDVELQEEYTYYTQADFQRALEKRQMRVVTNVELHNPWIVENRFRGHLHLTDTQGRPLPFPPTNHLVVGEKVRPGEGVALRESDRREISQPHFLQMQFYRHRQSGTVLELVHRPHRTVDVLPWFEEQGRVFVLARHGFPRPLANAHHACPDLMGLHSAGYITEPLAAIVDETLPVVDEARRILQERAALAPQDILHVGEPWRYFTSPGGMNERVDAVLAHIQPWKHERQIPPYTPFTTSGSIRHLEATQVLRACHVGGMFDARLELNIYRLCLTQQRAVGPWIGAALTLTDAGAVPPVTVTDAGTAVAVPQRQAFESVQGPAAARFLELREGTFVEVDAHGATLRTARFEYVLPRHLSHNTVTVLPLMRAGDAVLAGVELRDLPAVQAFEATSALLAVPACRLPRGVINLDQAEAHAIRQFEGEFGLRIHRLFALGGRYHPSVGVTPEVAYPFVADVTGVSAGRSALQWVPLTDLVRRAAELRDGHLLVAVMRAAHALGVLPNG